MYTKLKNKTTVNVIDRYGYDLDELTLTNTAAAELYPNGSYPHPVDGCGLSPQG